MRKRSEVKTEWQERCRRRLESGEIVTGIDKIYEEIMKSHMVNIKSIVCTTNIRVN